MQQPVRSGTCLDGAKQCDLRSIQLIIAVSKCCRSRRLGNVVVQVHAGPEWIMATVQGSDARIMGGPGHWQATGKPLASCWQPRKMTCSTSRRFPCPLSRSWAVRHRPSCSTSASDFNIFQYIISDSWCFLSSRQNSILMNRFYIYDFEFATPDGCNLSCGGHRCCLSRHSCRSCIACKLDMRLYCWLLCMQ